MDFSLRKAMTCQPFDSVILSLFRSLCFSASVDLLQGNSMDFSLRKSMLPH
jgi:hypothetical protein